MPYTRKHKRRLKRIVARHALIHQRDHLAERALMKAHIEACTEGGLIAVCRSGHDCDHMHYNSVRLVKPPRSFFAWLKAEEEHRAYLDGPESMTILPPSHVEEGESYRDVAAEMAGY